MTAVGRGTRLGRFELVERLGRGAMGDVWRARDPRLARDVALKLLPEELASGDTLARFEREARALAALSHPNVAQIHEVGEELLCRPDGSPGPRPIHFLVMELASGRTIAAALADGPFPVADAVRAARGIALGLAAAHGRGVIHRDLKPANVGLADDGGVKVLDFGLARLQPRTARVSDVDVTGELSQAGMVVGTAAYMSPEQMRGEECEGACDVWALGCCLAEMLSGEKLFSAASLPETIAAVLTTRPDLGKLPASVPAALAGLVRDCLSANPAQRPSMTDVARRLAEIEALLGARTGLRSGWLAAVVLLAIALGVTGWRLFAVRPGVTSAALPVLTVSVDGADDAGRPGSPGFEGRLRTELERSLAARDGVAAVRERGALRVRVDGPPNGAGDLDVRLTDGESGAVLAVLRGRVEQQGAQPGSPLAVAVADAVELQKIVRGLESEDAFLGFLARRTASLEAARAFRDGVGLHLRVRYRDAAAALARALDADPAFWPAELFLASIAKSTSHFDESAERLVRVREMVPRPEPVEATVIEMVEAISSEDAQRAVECLQRARGEFPGSGLLAYRLAVAYQGQDRPEQAIPLLRQLLDAGWQPDFPPVREYLALNQLLAGRARDALVTTAAGEDAFPQRYRFPQLAAYALVEIGRPTEAREAIARAIRKRIDFSRSDPLAAARDMAYWAALVRWPEEADRQWARTLDLAAARLRDDPSDADAAGAQIEALNALGRHDEALTAGERADRGDAYVLLALSRALTAAGRRHESRAALVAAGELWRAGNNPAAGTLAYNVGCGWAAHGDLERALDWLLRARDQYGFSRLDLDLDPELDPLRKAGLLEQLRR